MSETSKIEAQKTGGVANLTNAGKGRPKGVPNKNTAIIKDMIVAALEGAGGVEYLQRQANENPGPFLALVGKVLPMQLTGADGAALQIVINKPGA